MTRGGWIVLGAVVAFFLACALIACAIDWPNLAR